MGVKWFQNSKQDTSAGRIVAFIVIMAGVFILGVGCFISIWDTVFRTQSNLESIIFTSGSSIIGLGLGFQGWHKSSETKKEVAEIQKGE